MIKTSNDDAFALNLFSLCLCQVFLANHICKKKSTRKPIFFLTLEPLSLLFYFNKNPDNPKKLNLISSKSEKNNIRINERILTPFIAGSSLLSTNTIDCATKVCYPFGMHIYSFFNLPIFNLPILCLQYIKI